MAIKKFDHFSILAKKPEEVIEFYSKFLGYSLKYKKEIPLMHMNVFMLENNGELMEIIQPTGTDIKMSDGLKHIAFLSDDIEADFKDFVEKGAQMLHTEIQRSGDISFFFAKSPSGEMVEVIQHP
ncbi:MAG: VOC family protein [Firmicutes bacterium]|nr:VOC family protein [Bacillota bacterium]